MTREGQAFAQIDGIGRNSWMLRMARIGSEHGLFDRIGKSHLALFVDEGDTLLVAFDRAERARDVAADGMPAGFEMVRRRSWSLLSIMAQGETWFLDDALTRFFQTLHKRGVFDGYRRVIFYGVGPDCGFAATTFARFAPGRAGALGRPRGHARSRARALRTAVPQRTAPALHRPDGLRPRRDRGRRTRADPPRPDRDRPRRPCRALFRRERDPRRPAPCGPRLLPHPAGGEAAIPVLRLLEKGEATPEAVRAALKEACRRNPGTMVRRTRAALVQGHPRRAVLLAEQALALSGDKRLEALLAEARKAALTEGA
jgi:hypothetical protein